jgi:enoyl-CoA hydratase
MSYENLIVADAGFVRKISINRPNVLNALSRRTLQELHRVLTDTNHNENIRAVILTGSGDKSFVAGADIAELRGLSPLEAEAFSVLGQRVFEFIGTMRIPVIAAVNGYALGGGLELALACDFIYADDQATFGLVETKIGLIPGFGGHKALSERIGPAKARELIFTAAQISADEALRMGLVNRVVPNGEVVNAATLVAEKIAVRAPYAIGLAKQLLGLGSDMTTQSANRMESHCFGLVFSSRDHDEGIKAFIEKRHPTYVGA